MGRRPGAEAPAPLQGLPRVVLARQVPPGVVTARVRERSWQRVGHGVYLPGAPATPARLLAARIAGVARRSSAPVVFSHTSAALLWGLTLWKTPDEVHVRQPVRPSAHHGAGVVRHTGVDESEVRIVAGVRVTSLERTLVDCAAYLRPLAGLVVADSALAAGADPEVVGELVRAAAGARHAVRLRAVARYADGGSKSAYESASRFVVLRDGLPQPSTQIRVETRLGAVWGDWGWEEYALVAEYDGRVKYDDRDVFMAEKRRHDALVESGRRVLRVVKEDLTGTSLSARIVPLLPPAARRAVRPRPELRA